MRKLFQQYSCQEPSKTYKSMCTHRAEGLGLGVELEMGEEAK